MHTSNAPPQEATLTLHDEQPVGHGPQRSYFLVIDGTNSRLFLLPRSGEVIIGRGPEAALQLQDPTASRRHARVVCDAGAIVLSDLGSHNGTFVNGERLQVPRPLSSRDAISICDVTLVLHRDAGLPQQRSLHGEATLRERLEQEVARALHCQCPLALLCIDPGGTSREHIGASLTKSGNLRRMDFLAVQQGQLLVLLPELAAEEAARLARTLLEVVLPLSPNARIGLAVYPEDGVDADTLLSAAHMAASSAPSGELRLASDVVTELVAGEYTILLADPAMLRTFDLIARLARSDLPVLITGETGTGKELAAAALHHGSERAAARLIALNCAALPEALVEGELFGYERGAFSGAVTTKPGLLESAHGGTLFLDEVGELPLTTQAKLLRVLEVRKVTRLGDLRERSIDVRIVAATNRNLDDEVNAGRFRQDLLFRLSAAHITIPPLRDRTRELPLLMRRFLTAASSRLNRPMPEVSTMVIQKLMTYAWPGNVRELKNVMEYVASTCLEPVVGPWHLPQRLNQSPEERTPHDEACHSGAAREFRPLEEEIHELEKARMAQALRAAGGVQTRAAELLSMPVRTFTGKIRLYGLADLANTRRKDL